ncbi:hypothetical protein M2E15_1070 [Bacillus mycoides]|nr:hypothetical protein M2E15_1013 [Bacillus mycoides]KUH46257.1 hypothetical protein M2E15_1070 [Bacillus mycoides]OSY09415.1 hypothetical protein BTJ48_02036 [Bacillus mycoides]PKR94389.1 D-alanine--D-alanine ligase [Bacillus cereus Rock4-18]
MPGKTKKSLLLKSAQSAGNPFNELLETIIENSPKVRGNDV